MNGSNVLIDTNIALYLLAGNETIINLLDGKQVYFSFVTELELLGYRHASEKDKIEIRKLISNCIVVDINSEIKEHVIAIRTKSALKLPDAIIAGTALYLGLPVITADKGFKIVEDLNLVLYGESS